MPVTMNARPKVLLLGNGLNRAFGGVSWGDLMKKIALREDLPETLNCPMPLQAILVTNDHVRSALREHREDFMGNVPPDLGQRLVQLLDMGFDDILTTNYSYELEAAAAGTERAKESRLKSQCANIQPGRRAEQKYLISTCQRIPRGEGENRIWHIHGEARKPDSMILGHYYYAELLHRMKSFVQERRDHYYRSQQQGLPVIMKGWPDSFLLGNVYILGLSLDFSELDLWWLLNRKKREKADHGRVFYYMPNRRYPEKEALLELLDVQPVDLDMGPDVDWRAYYDAAVEDIARRMRSGSGEASS